MSFHDGVCTTTNSSQQQDSESRQSPTDVFECRVEIRPIRVRLSGVLEHLHEKEPVPWDSLDRLDEVGPKVEPVACFLVLARPNECFELGALFASREALFWKVSAVSVDVHAARRKERNGINYEEERN